MGGLAYAGGPVNAAATGDFSTALAAAAAGLTLADAGGSATAHAFVPGQVVGSDTAGGNGAVFGSFTITGGSGNVSALFSESGQNCSYSRLATDPGGENEIIMFKSCFPNSQLSGPDSPVPAIADDPLSAVAEGTGRVLQELQFLKRVSTNSK